MGCCGSRRGDCEISKGEMKVNARGAFGWSGVKLCLVPRSRIRGDSSVNG